MLNYYSPESIKSLMEMYIWEILKIEFKVKIQENPRYPGPLCLYIEWTDDEYKNLEILKLSEHFGITFLLEYDYELLNKILEEMFIGFKYIKWREELNMFIVESDNIRY
jgi:hypothetical protein